MLLGMYKLFFETNSQAFVVSLEKQDVQNTTLQTLVVNTDSRNEIFSLDLPSKLISLDGIDNDVEAIVDKIEIVEDTLSIYLDDNKKNTIFKIHPKESASIYVEQNKKKLIVYNNEKGAHKFSKLTIIIRYKDYYASFIVYCAPQNCIFDVVLDFGSEASQMLIKRADDDGAIMPQRLFHNTLKHYWSATVRGKRVYDQQDDDEKLFRSIFYKKEKGRMPENFEINVPEKKDPYFSFISKRTDLLGERIPNIKISYLTGKEAEGGEKIRLHTGVILRFLHEAIMQISDLADEQNISQSIPLAIRFTLLLPNVMPQDSVSKLMKRLREYANGESFMMAHKEGINIKYIDIQSCSESDASFLERMNEIGMKSGERCLTIDIGKGTTDFSITQKLGAYSASSEFRSGFVGAGNALSYAIFENCAQLLSKGNGKNLIKKILNSEPAMLYELDNLIENIKHDWKEDDSISKVEPIANVDAVSVEVILDRIRALGHIGDKSGSIRKMVENISKNIIDRLPDIRINKIVISGRAFRFKLLREILEEKLKEKFKSVECYYDFDSAKSGCLIGAASNIRLCLSSSIVGLPIIIDASRITNNPKEYIKQVGDSISTDETLPVLKKNKNINIDMIAKTIKNGLDVLKEWFGNDDSEFSNENHVASTKSDDVRELMSRGKEYRKIDGNSLISISGRFYVPGDGYMIDGKDKPFFIYFDGEKFFLRHKGGSHPLMASPIQGTQNLCYESYFPYSEKMM